VEHADVYANSLSVSELEDAYRENVGSIFYRVVFDHVGDWTEIWMEDGGIPLAERSMYGLSMMPLSIKVGVMFAFQRISRDVLLFSRVVGNTRPDIHGI
jgi:hypothetical protein